MRELAQFLSKVLEFPRGAEWIGKIRLFRRAYSYLYSLYGDCVFTVKVHGRKMYFPRKNVALAMLMANDMYERCTTTVLKKYLLSEKMVVIDLGASWGYYTLLFAKSVGDGGYVYAFEPEPVRYNFLRSSLRSNGYENVTEVNKAVADGEGTTSFWINGEESSLHNFGSSERKIEVEKTSLDEYFGRRKKVDLIKMDVEGSEMLVLRGASDILDKNQGLKIITEFKPRALKASGYSPEEFLEKLDSLGFELYRLDEENFRVVPSKASSLMREVRMRPDYSTNLLCIK